MLSQMQFGCYLVNNNVVYVSSDALPLYQILKQWDNWLWRYIAIPRFGGYRKCHHKCSLGVNLVIEIFYVASYTAPLY